MPKTSKHDIAYIDGSAAFHKTNIRTVSVHTIRIFIAGKRKLKLNCINYVS